MPRSVGIAPCDHEGRDYHRVLPARRQRRRALRPTGRRTPHQLRPPSARHRTPSSCWPGLPRWRDSDQRTAQGRVITLAAPRVPFAGGYRVLWRKRRLARLLTLLRPDALEVSDRTTLRWTGAWAREHGVPAAMVSHESVTALLKGLGLGGVGRAVADWLNRRTARAYQRVICTTGWAAGEFERIGEGNVVRVPLGVDLTTFAPRTGQVRAEGQILLVHCGRTSAGTGAWTGCTRTSAVTASSPAASTPCWPRPATRSAPAPTRSRPARRRSGWPRPAGWPPRAPPGWSGGPGTWCRPWWVWRCASGWLVKAHRKKTAPDANP